MAGETTKTFFSYARADSEFVLRLAKELRAAGADVWLDQLDIGPGEHWDSAIENALRICPRHVTVLSPEAVSSQNVMDEVSYALEEHKQVIPLLYRDCTVPFRLRRVQWVDFRRDYANGFRDLTRALGIKDAQLVPAPQVVPMKEAPAIPAPPVKPIEATQRPSEPGIQAEADAQAAPVVEQPPHEVGTGEAARQKGGGRKVEQAGAAASEPRIWPDAKVLWIAGVVVVALALGIWMISSGRDAESFYQQGADLYKQKQYDQAIDAFTQAIRLKPDYAVAYNDRGIAYDDEKNYDLAIQDYNQAIKLNPNYANAYNNRGNAYSDEKNYDLAIQDYNQALKLDPNYADAYNNRGVAYEKKKQYQQALQDYDRALSADPNVKNAQKNRERVAAMLKEQGRP
jgi:tetratricopeptide (TPR) repeat protein